MIEIVEVWFKIGIIYIGREAIVVDGEVCEELPPPRSRVVPVTLEVKSLAVKAAAGCYRTPQGFLEGLAW